MTMLWLVIITQSSLLHTKAYIGVGIMAHPTEQGCLDEAEGIKAYMIKAGHDVTVICEKLPLDLR